MKDIGKRFQEAIEDAGITKKQAAEKLGVSGAYVTQICSGARTPSDRTMADICREFNIRREWLETGEGPMKMPEIDSDVEYLSGLLNDIDDPVADWIRRIYKVYRELPEKDKEQLKKFARSLRDQK